MNSKNSFTKWTELNREKQSVLMRVPESPPNFMYPDWWAGDDPKAGTDDLPEGQSGAAAGEMSAPISAEAGEGAIAAGAESSSAAAAGGLGEAAASMIPEGVASAGSFVGDLALQAVPFVGEAVDLGLLAFGVYQGVQQYEKDKQNRSLHKATQLTHLQIQVSNLVH